MTPKEARRRIMFERASAQLPPMIRLKGRWLLSAGFIPGKHVEVIITGPGEILIRPPPQPVDCADETRARFLTKCAKLGL